MKLTFLTTTYNRAYKLKELYKSLASQTCFDFIWLIIDDGSQDNTKNEVNNIIKKENKFKIEYIYKQNGGKHKALNIGISKIKTDLFCVVDDDEFIVCDAVESILNIHKRYKENDRICGYSFLEKYPNNRIMGKKYPEDEILSDYICMRLNRNDIFEEKSEVWKTKILKMYPFPEFEEERFLGEDVVWIKMALKYNMLFVNKVIAITEYLGDGLTVNRRRNNINSPKGCCYRAKVILEAYEKRKIKNETFFVKSMLQYQVYGRFAKESLRDLYKETSFKKWYILLYPFAWIIYLKWKYFCRSKI